MILKTLQFQKKEIGIKSQKLYKQVNDQKAIGTRWNSMVVTEQKLIVKHLLSSCQNRDNKYFRINFVL